jgi:hypothetical protein
MGQDNSDFLTAVRLLRDSVTDVVVGRPVVHWTMQADISMADAWDAFITHLRDNRWQDAFTGSSEYNPPKRTMRRTQSGTTGAPVGVVLCGGRWGISTRLWK